MKAYNKGFTLIEVILSLTILSIISIFLVSVMAPQIRIYKQSNEKTQGKSMCNTVYTYVIDDLRYKSKEEIDAINFSEDSTYTENIVSKIFPEFADKDNAYYIDLKVKTDNLPRISIQVSYMNHTAENIEAIYTVDGTIMCQNYK